MKAALRNPSRFKTNESLGTLPVICDAAYLSWLVSSSPALKKKKIVDDLRSFPVSSTPSYLLLIQACIKIIM